jgi:hypothetical protein
MSDAQNSPHSNILTSVFDRLVSIGWVESYASDINYRIQAIYTAEGVAALSRIRHDLGKVGPLSDIQLSALRWIADTNAPK